MIDGETNPGVWSCGMVAGLINDTPTCEDLVNRIVSGAEAIIRGRLTRICGPA